MNFKRITNSSNIEFDLTWSTYSLNFPNYEKRLKKSHIEAINEKKFIANSIYDNNEYIGFIFYWDLDPYIFVEHFAIEKDFRSKKYGSKIIKKLIEDNSSRIILLEIDPPSDDISLRRLNFYSQLGFKTNDIIHYNLPYQKDLLGYELNLLSHNRQITEDEYHLFNKLLVNSACKYCE